MAHAVEARVIAQQDERTLVRMSDLRAMHDPVVFAPNGQRSLPGVRRMSRYCHPLAPPEGVERCRSYRRVEGRLGLR